MRLARNLLAGLANSTWTAVIGLMVVPFYLKYLGIETFGLIGFFATMQGLLSLLDLGLGATVNREVARCSASGKLREAGNLLHTLAVIYWGMAGLIALCIAVLAPYIAEYWLQSSSISRENVAHAVMLMGFVVACRWPVGLYQGAVMGAQRLTVSSGISIAIVTIRDLGAVAVLAFVSQTIEAFFIWQASVGIAYAAVMRWAAWWAVGQAARARFDVAGLKRIWRFSAGMSGVAVSAVILMQLDKVLLSRILSLEDFGRYTLAALLAGGLYVLLTPVFNAIYPRLSALVATGETAKMTDLYRSGTRLLMAILFPLAMTAAVFSEELVYLWTGNLELAVRVAPIASLFLIGTAMNGAMHFPYALQLAYGMARLPLVINAVLMIALVPMIITLSLRYGAVGGAAAWALLNGLYLLLGTWLTHRYMLKGIGLKWLMGDVATPLGLSLLIVGGGGQAVHGWAYPPYLKLLIGCGLGFLAFICIVLMSPVLLSVARGRFAQAITIRSNLS